MLTGNPLTGITLAMHVILTGAIWPNEHRLRTFLEPSP
jgi:hypothetical protein